MSLRKSKFLIRTLLLIICFQFIGTSFVSVEVGNSSGSHHAFTTQKQAKPLTLSSLFEKTEKEGEEREKDFFVELPDFNFYDFKYISSVPTILRTDIISFHIQEPPLFRLHCVFLI